MRENEREGKEKGEKRKKDRAVSKAPNYKRHSSRNIYLHACVYLKSERREEIVEKVRENISKHASSCIS